MTSLRQIIFIFLENVLDSIGNLHSSVNNW